MKKKLEEIIRDDDKYHPSSIEAGYDQYESQEEEIDREEMEHDEYEK